MSDRYKHCLADMNSLISDFNETINSFLVPHLFKCSDKKQYVYRMQKIRDSLIYRSGSISWHVNSMCAISVAYENRTDIESDNFKLISQSVSLYYMFDDVIFNLISFYDYYAFFIYLYFAGDNKGKIYWNNIAQHVRGKQSNFPNTWICESIMDHDKKWVSKIYDYRSDIIHKNHKIGKSGVIWKAKRRHEGASSLMLTVPEALSKKLCFRSEQGTYDNFDLQHGTVEIVHRSFLWISSTMKKITEVSE